MIGVVNPQIKSGEKDMNTEHIMQFERVAK